MNIKVSVNPKNKVKENVCCCKEIHPGRALLIGLEGGKKPCQGEGNDRSWHGALKNHPWVVPGARLSLGYVQLTGLGDSQSHLMIQNGENKPMVYVEYPDYVMGPEAFFFWKLWKIFIRLPFHSSQPLGAWVFVRTQAPRGGSSGIKSLSSCYPTMLLNHCRFSRYVYEILQESEADPKVLDDPFKRSKAFETWNRYNNEGMGLGLIWERYSSFCLNEDNSRGISKSQIILILCVSKNALGSWTDWNKVEVYYCYFFHEMRTLEEPGSWLVQLLRDDTSSSFCHPDRKQKDTGEEGKGMY